MSDTANGADTSTQAPSRPAEHHIVIRGEHAHAQPQQAQPGTHRGAEPPPVPYTRFQELASERRELKQQLEQAQQRAQQLAEAQANLLTQEAVEERIKAEVSRVEREWSQRVALTEAASEFRNLGHASMQRRLMKEYRDYAADTGEQALDFREWLKSDDLRQDPLWAPHFTPQQAAAGSGQFGAGAEGSQEGVGNAEQNSPPQPVAPKPAPPNANAGALPTPTGTERYGAEDLQRLRSKGKLTGSTLHAAMKQLESDGEIAPLSPAIRQRLGMG